MSSYRIGWSRTAAHDRSPRACCAHVLNTDAPLFPTPARALDGLARGWAHIERATRDGTDREARMNLMSASMQGALAFQKGLGCVHSLSHSLGGIDPRLHHGTLNAIFLPAVIAFNEEAASVREEHKLERLAQASEEASSLGLHVAAGHGLDYGNVAPVVRIPGIELDAPAAPQLPQW